MATGAHTTNIILESRRAAGVGWIKGNVEREARARGGTSGCWIG